MNPLNYVYFEEYKRLDKLCGELYKDRHGMTHYIDDMRAVSNTDYFCIPGWKKDLEQLVRLRHIRNYLAHTEGAFEEEVCTKKDIEEVRTFYERILNQSDPIALLYQKARERKQTGSRGNKRSEGTTDNRTSGAWDLPEYEPRETSHWPIFVLVILIIAVLAVLYKISI